MSINREKFSGRFCVKEVKNFEERPQPDEWQPLCQWFRNFHAERILCKGELVRHTDGGMVGVNVIPVPIGFVPFAGHKNSLLGICIASARMHTASLRKANVTKPDGLMRKKKKNKEVSTWDGTI